MRKTLLSLLLSVAAATVGCTQNKSIDAPITELPANVLKAQWTRTLEMKGSTPKSMFVRGDDLFVYRADNLLYRLDRKSGDVKFVTNVAGKGDKVGAPLILGDEILIPADTKLHVVDERGFRVTSVDIGQPMRSGVVADNEGIYVGIDFERSFGRIVCIELERPDSPFRWQLLTGGTVVSTPALYEGILYAGSDDGKVYAVDSDRTAIWAIETFQTDGTIRGDLAADASGVYVPSADMKLYCLNRADGRVRWQYHAGTPLFGSPSLTSTSVYINVPDQGVVCLAKGDGAYNRQPKWINADAKEFLAEDQKLTYLRGKDNTILAVDKETGVLKAQSQRGDLVAFAVNTIDGLVYAATRGGKVIAAVAVTKPGDVGEIVFADPAEALQLASR